MSRAVRNKLTLRAQRFPLHVVVLKNWQSSSKNFTQKWSPRKVPVVNTARAPTLPHEWLRQDIGECWSDLSKFLPPRRSHSVTEILHRVLRDHKNSRLGKAGQTQESNFRGRLGGDQQAFWRRPRRASTSGADRILLVRHYQPLVPTSMRGPKCVAERRPHLRNEQQRQT